MRNFTNPLDNIHVASPCSANWDEMFGNDRKRFCGECNLNVYNLSNLTRREAENLLINSEGRLCVRFFRRADGTVLTKNCPVGWQAVKQRVSRLTTAVFSMVAGLFSGIFAFNLFSSASSHEILSPISETSVLVETREDILMPTTAEAGAVEFRGRMELGGLPRLSAIDERQIKIKRNIFRKRKVAKR